MTGCSHLRKAPRPTKCLINHPAKRLDCINTYGTKFQIQYSEKDMDKMVCMPGDQFIDVMAWLKETIVILTEDITRSKGR